MSFTGHYNANALSCATTIVFFLEKQNVCNKFHFRNPHGQRRGFETFFTTFAHLDRVIIKCLNVCHNYADENDQKNLIFYSSSDFFITLGAPHHLTSVR